MVTKQDTIKLANSRFANLESQIDERLKLGLFMYYDFYSEQEMEYFKTELKPQYEKAGWNIEIKWIQSNSNDQRETSYYKAIFS